MVKVRVSESEGKLLSVRVNAILTFCLYPNLYDVNHSGLICKSQRHGESQGRGEGHE